jgi:hypothetical protein
VVLSGSDAVTVSGEEVTAVTPVVRD